MGRSGKGPREELSPDISPKFLVKKVDNQNQILQVELTQVPEIQASLVTVNAHTGEIVCMVGGYDFHTNKFNNATQGLRQTGSAYKPFIYTAAVEDGMTPGHACQRCSDQTRRMDAAQLRRQHGAIRMCR
jgi:penicillin-binding protein 1A